MASDPDSSDARALIERLGLTRHPEGGWYRETWRAPSMSGERGLATAIHFLLEKGERSHWHRVDATEIWLWHAGSALDLLTAPGETGPIATYRLGGDVLAGQAPQHVIAPDNWQAAEARFGWALVSCIVAPAFEFSGFTLAAPGWAPGG
ncbi:MAG: cupin domain-containing protein [Sphingobium sp.]|nr:cupin domain-containing protein [Sphingobium sp.]